MMKKLLLGATLATAALASTPLLADPAGHRHGQNTPCAGANCPEPQAATGQAGSHGMGRGGMHGRMQSMRHGSEGHHGKGAQRGAGADCPMHAERKPT